VNDLPLLMVLLGGALTLTVGYLCANFWAVPARGMVFAITGLGPLHDARVYSRLGQPYHKHLIPAALSAVVAIWALTLHINAGAA